MARSRKVLVVGSGGREHAIVSALGRSEAGARIYCAPGNGGIAGEAEIVGIDAGSPEGIEKLCSFARAEGIDLTVVGPELPLVLGAVDRFEAEGLRIFGPPASGARLEGSKAFTKEFLARHSIPTAPFRIFEDAGEAARYLESAPLPIVLKADGLAAGKGVIVAREREEALAAHRSILVERRFGDAGRRLVVEECLEGDELSLLVVTDGEEYIPLETAQDYKRLLDGDRGPNTGGMGAYSPSLSLGEPIIQRTLDAVIRPTLRGLREEGIPFRGTLYAGLMLTSGGPKLLEYNVRFGDPETQPILSRLRTDFLELLEAVLTPGALSRFTLDWDPRPAVCVVAASEGYPGPYRKGAVISGLEEARRAAPADALSIYHAGTVRLASGEAATSGGRVLGVTALGEDRRSARERAYGALERIRFDGMQFRRDIAAGE